MAVNELTFVATKRGGRNAVFNGFIYQKKKEDAVSIYWYCTKRDSDGCRGSLKTLVTMDGPAVSLLNTNVCYYD